MSLSLSLLSANIYGRLSTCLVRCKNYWNYLATKEIPFHRYINKVQISYCNVRIITNLRVLGRALPWHMKCLGNTKKKCFMLRRFSKEILYIFVTCYLAKPRQSKLHSLWSFILVLGTCAEEWICPQPKLWHIAWYSV